MAKYSNTVSYNIQTTLDASGIAKLQAEIRNVEAELTRMSASSLISDRSYRDATQKISSLRQILNQSFNANLGMLDMSKVTQGLKNANLSLGELRASFLAAGTAGEKAFNDTLGRLGKIDTGIRSVSKTTDKLFNTIGNTVRWGVVASGFQTILNSAHQTVQYVRDLDTSLTNIMMVTQQSKEQMNEFAQSANDAAKALSSTTVNMTDAALVFAQQGFNTDMSSELAKRSTQLANISQQDTPTTSDQITTIMNAYDFTGDLAQIDAAMDSWANVANVSAADVEELATAAQKAASTANTTGVTLDQLNAQIATIESVTREAPENIGNALKTIYSRFADISMGNTLEDGVNLGNIAETLGKVGVEVLNDEGRMNNVGDIMEQLMEVWSTLDQTQQNAISTVIAGRYQLSRFQALMNRSDLYQDYLGASQNAEGTADQMQEIYANSMEGRLNQLQATAEGIFNDIFNTDDFYGMIDALSTILDLTNQWINALGGAGPLLTGIASIATRAFSSNIASGLNNFIANRQSGKQVKANQQQAKNVLQQSGLDANSARNADLVKYISDSLNSADSMTEQQITQTNKNIEQTVALKNEELDLEKQILAAATAVNEANRQRYISQGEEPPSEDLIKISRDEQGRLNLDSTAYTMLAEDQLAELQKTTESKNYKATLSQRYNDFAEISVAISDISRRFESLGKEGGASLEKINGDIIALLRSAGDFKSKFSGAEFTPFISALERVGVLSNSIKTDMSEQEIEQLRQAFHNLLSESSRTTEMLDVSTFVDPRSVQRLQQQQIGNQERQNAQQRVNEAAQASMDRQISIDKIINAAGAVGQLAFSWQSFQSLGSLWANTDLDDGEKLTQTVMNLAGVVPMAASGIGELTNALSSLGLKAGPVGIALTAITVAIGAVATALSYHAQEIENAIKQEEEAFSSALETSNSAVTTANSFETLYSSFKETGQASEEFIQSCRDTAEALDISGANALIAAGNYDVLADSIQRAKDSELQDTIEKANTVLNGTNNKIFREGDITNGSLFSDAANNLVSQNSQIFDEALALMGFERTSGLALGEDMKNNMSNADFIRFSNAYIQMLQERVDSLSNLTDEEIEAQGGQEAVNRQLENAQGALSDWTSKIVEAEEYQNVNSAITEQANARVQQSDFQESLAGLSSAEEILSVFSSDEYVGNYFNKLTTDAEKLEFAINNVADAQQKLILEGAQASANLKDTLTEQGLSDEDVSSIVSQAESRLSDEELIEFVGGLDVDLTRDNIQDEITKFLNGQLSLELTATTNLNTEELSSINESISALDSLKSSYESVYADQGGFNSGDVAELLQENPEYINYLTKVGDLYQLNQEFLDDWTAASEKQQSFIKEAMDTSYSSLLEENDLMRRADFSAVSTNGGSIDTASAANTIESLNQALANGESTVEEYAAGIEGLTQQLDGLGNLSSYGEGNDLGLDTSEIEQIGSLYETIASSIQDVMEQTTKAFQRGEMSLGDYLNTLGDLAKASAKTEATMRGMRKEGDKWVAVAEDGTDATDETSKALADQVNETEEAGNQLEDLSGVYDVFSNDGRQLIDWFGEFGDTINNASIEAAKSSGEFQAVISNLANSAAQFYLNNTEELGNFLNNFNAQADASSRITQAQMANLISAAGQGQAQFGAVLNGIMVNNTEFTAAMVSNLLGNMETQVAVAASGISSMITGVEQLLSGFSVDITGEVQQTGTTEVGGFGLDLSGTGIMGMASEVLGDLTGSLSIPTFRMHIGTENAHFSNKDAAANSFAQGAGIVSNVFGSDGAGISDFLGGNNGAATTPYVPSGGGSGGSGGSGGGGGGGSSYEPKTKDPIEDELDRYERVNTMLEDAENRYERLNADRERLTGFDMADDMEKEVELLNRQIALHREKLEIQKEEAQELKDELSSQYGITFDAEGFITNYAATHDRLVNEVNSLINQYNNTSTEEGQEALEKQIEDAQDALDDFNETYQRYDELWAGDLQETLNTLEDLEDQIEDIRIEMMNTSIEAVDNLQDLQESLNEFNNTFEHFGEDTGLRDAELAASNLATYFDIANESASALYDTLIQRANDRLNSGILSDDERQRIQQDIAMWENARKQIGAGSMEAGGTGLFDMAFNNMRIIQEQIRQYEETGTSTIFGENSADLYDAAKEAYDQATGLLSDYEGHYEDLHDAILTMIDEEAEKIEKRREQYENITDELDHQREIIELIHGDEAYNELNMIYDAQNQNYLASINEMQQTLDYWKELRDQMEEGSEEWEAINEQIMDTQSELNDLVEESLDNLQEKYENTVNNILDTWTSNAFGGTDLDWVAEEWELINRNADYYLDDVNAAYETQKLQGKYLEMLDQTDDLHIQQMITEQMKQQLDYLQAKDKLSEYDVAYANAQLEILQKRIALEEAQRNKSQMQLRRDSQGNYSYVYTADEGDVSAAEGDLLDAQNNAYNLSKEQMQQTQADSLSALQDAQQLLNDIWTNANLTLDEKTERTQTVIDSLKEYLAGTAEQLSESEKNIINDFIGMAEMMTDENAGRIEDVLEQVKDGNLEAFDIIDDRWSTALSNWLLNLDEFNISTDDSFSQLIENSVEFQENVDSIASEVNQDFSDMGDTISKVTDQTKDLASATSDFINQLESDSGIILKYEDQLESMREKIADTTNEMRAYQQQVNQLQSDLTAKEQENANLSAEIETLKAENAALKNPSGSGGGGGGSNFGGSGYSQSDLAWGIAQNIWTYGWAGGWGNDPTRSGKLTGAYGSSFARQVQDIINQNWSSGNLVNYGSDKFSSYSLIGYDTGGYTGSWSDGNSDAKNGKLAYLHQKELVLNAADTENILKAVDIVRQMVQTLKSSAVADTFSNIANSVSAQPSGETVEQNVHITAEFPAANSAAEIESALLSLNERAIQYSFRKK